ncbi:MAG TPA: tRNA (N6-threonylcarbamoyladenosine(37)-N6)-methyltransferase TrmO, partial [Methanomicrobiales archaeon]|nr:tRNA (N6-threonylcarbamoyladenosine(37)-N6)-methyltransferase TrmO [Methanomicrobiales archaeon]
MPEQRDRVFSYRPIGVIRSPYQDPEGMPIQPGGARGVVGKVEVFAEYRDGLADLDGFSRIILLYPFHRSSGYSLVVTPFLDTRPRGLFSTRAPRRPNAIGLSIVRLTGVLEGELDIADVDILDGTPLLDIKPYIPAFDSFPDERSGWLGGCGERVVTAKSDGRFLHRKGDS